MFTALRNLFGGKKPQGPFVRQDALPVTATLEDQQALMNLGIVFHGPYLGQPGLARVTLPEGWRHEPKTNEASFVYDAKGNVRAVCQYSSDPTSPPKIMVSGRYQIKTEQARHGAYWGTLVQVVDNKTGEIIKTFEAFADSNDMAIEMSTRQQAFEEAERWLGEHYPSWRNKGRNENWDN